MVLVLTLVYCTKKLINGLIRKYGPYGPYYYQYWWDSVASVTRSRYVGILKPKPRLPPRIDPYWWGYTTSQREDIAIGLIESHTLDFIRFRGYGLRDGDCSDVKPWSVADCDDNAAYRVLVLGDPERQGTKNSLRCCYTLQKTKPKTGDPGFPYVKGTGWRLPVFVVATSAKHYICAIQLEEEADKLGDWLFFQYDNANIQIGDWQLPHGCIIYIDDVYSVGCYGWMGDLVKTFRVP